MLRHYSDEELLAHLDGELPSHAGWRVRRHLNRCWECRSRRDALERQTNAAVALLSDVDFLGPRRLAQAENRFLRRKRAFELGLKPGPGFRLLPKPRRNAWSMAALALLGLVSIWIWRVSHDAAPQAAEVLRRAGDFESGLLHSGSPVIQQFRLEIAELRPSPKLLAGTLETWSDPEAGRSVSRWKRADGSLRHAVWRSAPEDYVYDEARSPVALRLARGQPAGTLASGMEPGTVDFADVERALIRRLESGDWQPIVIAPDFSLFAGRNEALLKAERVASADGADRFRLTAVSRRDGLAIEMLLEVDAATYRPRLQRIRFATPERTLQLQLLTERMEAVPRDRLSPSVFSVERLPAQAPRKARLDAPAPASVPERKLESRPVSAAEFSAKAIELHYALHQARACLGEPVDIKRVGAGTLLVRGVVSTASRKEQILAALGAAGLPDWVMVDIETTAELAAAGPSAPEARVRVVESGEVRDRLPLHARLAAHFAGSAAAGDARVAQTVARFAGNVVSRAEAGYLEAWALYHLAREFGDDRSRQAPPDSLRLLRIMLREHLAALGRGTADLRGLLRTIRPESVASAAAGLPDGHGWAAGIVGSFEIENDIYSRVLALFATGSAPASPDAEASLDELIARLSALDARLDLAVRAVAAEFPSEGQLAAEGRQPTK